MCRTGRVCPDCIYSYLSKVYCSLLKSIDLMNRENAFKYLGISSLLSGGQCPPQAVMCCFKEFLCCFSILHSYICSVDCAHSLKGTSGCTPVCVVNFYM